MGNNNEVSKTTGATPTTDKGVRPEVKIGADFPSTDKQSNSGNNWAFSYTPGEEVLEMQVVMSGGIIPPPSPLVMDIEASGVDDIIAWLAGVKNLIGQAKTANASNAGDGS